MVENNFSKVSRLFSHIVRHVLLVLLQGFFKKAGIQFKCNNMLRNGNKEYQTLKVFHTTPEYIVKSQSVSTTNLKATPSNKVF